MDNCVSPIFQNQAAFDNKELAVRNALLLVSATRMIFFCVFAQFGFVCLQGANPQARDVIGRTVIHLCLSQNCPTALLDMLVRMDAD